MKQHLAPLFALAAAVLVVVPVATAAPHRATAAVSTIATASTSDFRAQLVARRTSSGSAPTATTTLTAYHHTGRGWERVVSKRLAGTFFWKTLTGPRAVCRFELATAGHPHITVELLQSPALGCAHSQSISLER
jgi:hypothetical protein